MFGKRTKPDNDDDDAVRPGTQLKKEIVDLYSQGDISARSSWCHQVKRPPEEAPQDLHLATALPMRCPFERQGWSRGACSHDILAST